MNSKLTNQAKNKPHQDKTKRYRNALQIPSSKLSPEEIMDKLLSTMQKVETESPEAKANVTSMDDNNDGRIIYVETEESLAKKGIRIIKKDGLELGRKLGKQKATRKRKGSWVTVKKP